MKSYLLFFYLMLLSALAGACKTRPVRTGLDNVAEHSKLFAGKRVGIITTHTGYNSEGKHIIDIFSEMPDVRLIPDVRLAALFGPEHGIRGSTEDGRQVDSARDPARNVPIFSLYGKTRKPTPEMLANLDVLVFDIQDIGARFYTYVSTMALAMEAAAENQIPFVVLDRPNPLNGVDVEGNILEPEQRTFVGMFPIPVRHGMTVGELAQMINGEGWLANGVRADLTVIQMKNWRREFWYDQTGLRFIKPSPNMVSLRAATIYPGACLIEGTNVSEGRGTATPFEIIGAPWIDGKQLAEVLNDLRLPGVAFRDTTFTPKSIPGAATNPKYKNQTCGGVYIETRDRHVFQPYRSGIELVATLRRLYPDSLRFNVYHFDRLCGSSKIRQAILSGASIDKLVAGWQPEVNAFLELRKKYLIYP